MAILKAEVLKQMSDCNLLKNAPPDFLEHLDKVCGFSEDTSLFRLLQKTSDTQETVHVGMAIFLYEYESHYLSCVDFVCYLLIANGHDLLNLRTRKYAKSMQEISEIDACTKLDFLDAHNLSIFNRKKDRKLRNRIAHNQLLVIDEKTAQATLKEVLTSIYDLSGFISQVLDVFKECTMKLAITYSIKEKKVQS